jgi:hypothetical protein
MRGAQQMMEMIMRTLTPTLATLATLAAAAAVAGSAQAQNSGPSSSAYASPPRPIPHSQLDAYLRASPRERATRDWWADQPAATAAAQTATSTAANAQASSSLPSQVRTTTAPAPTQNRPSLSTASPRSDGEAAVRGPTEARPGVTGGPSSGAGQGVPVRP